MLSYRHAFHAGNHADVLKHFVLSQVLHYFNQKDKPYWVIDTHAGAGMYALKSAFAQKNAEFENGIARLMAAENLPESLVNFKNIVLSFNSENQLDFYPGSPKIAEHCCREQDKLRLFELHPSDFKLLAENFSHQEKQTKTLQQDGFSSIKACLPPPTKRAVILIDPPYEVKNDYDKVVETVQDGLKRFATGTYLIWYPLLQRPEPQMMIKHLKNLNAANWLDVTLSVQAPAMDGFGMHGSGMLMINPPWVLPKTLAACMPVLTDLLAMDAAANFHIDAQIS